MKTYQDFYKAMGDARTVDYFDEQDAFGAGCYGLYAFGVIAVSVYDSSLDDGEAVGLVEVRVTTPSESVSLDIPSDGDFAPVFDAIDEASRIYGSTWGGYDDENA